MACTTSNNSQSDQKPEPEIESGWFTAGEWRQGWTVVPDESVDQEEFALQYRKNPAAWDEAFRFLAETDLATIKTGRYELQGEKLFVNIDEYETRNEEDTRYEAHRKYADIQYMVSGSERIGVLPIEKTTVTEPYDAEKDIMFMEADEDNFRLADQDKFFIFFPDDAHRPGAKNENNMQIRKAVVKVRIDQR
jgi:YhcH/YjgK/YiaL family protein